MYEKVTYTLTAPMLITSRLLPGARIGAFTVSVEPLAQKNGGIETAVYIDGPGGILYANTECLTIRGKAQADVPREAVRVLCSFLSAAAESYPSGENSYLFPVAVTRWAVEHYSEIESLALDLESTTDENSIESDLSPCEEYGHAWVGGMSHVDQEDAATVNAERLARGLDPLECLRCEASYA